MGSYRPNGEAEKPLESDSGKKSGGGPHRVRLPGFISEEIGLGDVIKHVTYATGIKACTGCQRRAAALNRWLVFSPSRVDKSGRT